MTVINAAASGRSFQLIKPRRGRLQTDHSESEEEEDAGIESPPQPNRKLVHFSPAQKKATQEYTRDTRTKKIILPVVITNESVKKKLSMTKQRSYMENVYLLMSDQFQVLVHLYLMYQLIKFHQKDEH